MPMKEIQVHLDETDRCQTRLEVAIALALRHQAHLTGVYATTRLYPPGLQVDTHPEVSAAETRFRQRTDTAGIAADWICTDATGLTPGVSERVILQAYYTDLVIVGQADPASGSLGPPGDLPERLALSCGRPVLVVPRHWEFHTIGQRILLAWRGGRASSRALNDAIPLLEQAEQVKLLMVNPGDDFELQAGNLRSYLGQHGITASVDRLTAEDVHAGDILLNQACDLEIDLVILGVFAHRRLGKVGLGPVGKHILEYMTTPVLMSR